MRLNRKAAIAIIIAVAVLVLLGGGGFIVYTRVILPRQQQADIMSQLSEYDTSSTPSVAPSFMDQISITEYTDPIVGDVVNFDDYNYQLGGSILHTSTSATTYSVTYEDESGHQYEATIDRNTVNNYQDLVDAYMKGDDSLVEQLVSISTGQPKCYYYKYGGMFIPLFCVNYGGVDNWYSLICTDTLAYMTKSYTPIRLTNVMATKKYRDVKDIDYSYRTRAHYEEEAIQNTIAAYTEGADFTSSDDSDFGVSDDYVVGTSTLDQLRTIATKYNKAKATESTYESIAVSENEVNSHTIRIDPEEGNIDVAEFSIDDLHFSDLNLAYDSSAGNIHWFRGLSDGDSITITNEGSSEARFIVMVKYISNEGILDYSLIDVSQEPLSPGDSRVFPVTQGESFNEGVLRAIQIKVF